MTESGRIYVRNLLANWLGYGASMVVLLFLSPLVVHTLGKVEYGIWSLLMVLTGYMGLLDLGIRASTGRYVILYLGRGDHQKVDETIRTGLGFFAAAGGCSPPPRAWPWGCLSVLLTGREAAVASRDIRTAQLPGPRGRILASPYHPQTTGFG
jgi:hypothetical protein